MNDLDHYRNQCTFKIARAVLEKWGNYPAIPDSLIYTPLPHL